MSSVLDDAVESFEPAPEFLSTFAISKSSIVLGLDIGTSGVRATLFDESGQEIEGASVRTQHSFLGSDDYSVLDPETIIESVIDAIDRLLVKPEAFTAELQLISISCFWHSLIGIDDGNQPTTPILGWADTRAAKAAQHLRSSFDENEIHSRTGCRFHPSYWPAKLLWLRSEQQETFAATKHWMSFSEFLTFRLFNDLRISVSMASGTGLLNIRTCQWDQLLLQDLGISVESLPNIAQETITEATLNEEYASRWPQLRHARLCAAIADGAANNVGSGCTTRDKIAVMIGTSGATRVLFAGEPPASIPSELWCYRADRSRVVVGGALSDGGGLFRRLHELFLPNDPVDEIRRSLEMIEPDAHGLTILPFWAGERSTGWSLDARGAILGLTLETKPVDILRAAMEAIAYRLSLAVRALNPIAPGAAIIASGNALQSSPVWVQILTDVLDRPVNLSRTREASARGAALLALEAAGKIQTIDDDNDKVEKIFVPDASRHAIYQKAIDRQQRIYDALRLDL